MKRWIIGAVLLGICTGAYGAAWIYIGPNSNGGIDYIAPAGVYHEVWVKTIYSRPRRLVRSVYNKAVDLYKVNCDEQSSVLIQSYYSMEGYGVETVPGDGNPMYAPPGTLGANIVTVACGAK
jgi:hypothetical protein